MDSRLKQIGIYWLTVSIILGIIGGRLQIGATIVQIILWLIINFPIALGIYYWREIKRFIEKILKNVRRKTHNE